MKSTIKIQSLVYLGCLTFSLQIAYAQDPLPSWNDTAVQPQRGCDRTIGRWFVDQTLNDSESRTIDSGRFAEAPLQRWLERKKIHRRVR